MKLECTVEEWHELLHGTTAQKDTGQLTVVLKSGMTNRSPDEMVAKVAAMQKEYSCNCTLSVNTDQCFELSGGES